MKPFGKKLKELRKKVGLSQQALADAAGVHRMAIAKLESGKHEPTWTTVIGICDALGVSCEAFQKAKGGK